MKTTCSETEEKWQKRIQFFDVGNNSEMCKIRKTLKLLWDRENKGRRSPGKTLPIYCHQDFASLSYFMRVFGSNIPTHFHWPLLLLSVIFLCTTFGNLSCQLLEFSCILIPKIFRIQKTVKEGQRKNISWLLGFDPSSFNQEYTLYFKRNKTEQTILLLCCFSFCWL